MNRRETLLAGAAVFLVAVAASSVGILNGFAYDDRFIIVNNAAINELPRWWKMFTWTYWPRHLSGDGYRPLTILLFAIQWAVGDGKPMLFHAVNILLYGLVSVGVFWLASLLLPLAYAALAAALFAAHPVHVEAVANVVGQAELTVGLAAVYAVILYIRWRTIGTGVLDAKRQAALVAIYFVACFAKEHAIMIPALLMAAEVLLVESREAPIPRLNRLRQLWLAMIAAGLAFLWARSLVHPGAGFQIYVPFRVLEVGTWNRVLTMVQMVPEWVRLLLWPAHLQTEYGPPEFMPADGLHPSQLPGFLILAGTVGLVFAARKRAPAVAFGIAWIVITLLPVSNFIVPTGILIAERTLFLPSVGAMLAIGAAMAPVAARIRTPFIRPVALSAVLALIVAGTVKSFVRTQVWRDDETLFSAAVEDAPYSYRSHYILSGWRFAQGRPREAEVEARIALHLFPTEPFMAFYLGEAYRKAGMYEHAAEMFEHAISITPDYEHAITRLAITRAAQGRLDEARVHAIAALRLGHSEFKVLREIILASGAIERRAASDTGASRILPDSAQIAPAGGIPDGR